MLITNSVKNYIILLIVDAKLPHKQYLKLWNN